MKEVHDQRRRVLAGLCLVTGVIFFAGCYEKRVTRGTGITSHRGTVEQSDRPDGPLEAVGDVIFGRGAR